MSYAPLGPRMNCKVCARPLQQENNSIGGGCLVEIVYSHGYQLPGTPPHEPVPIPAPEGHMDQVSVCDFCQAPGPTWCYPCKSFAVPVPGGERHYGSVEDWGACETCHSDIEADRWAALEKRNIATYGPIDARTEKMLRSLLPKFWGKFRENRNGEAQKI